MRADFGRYLPVRRIVGAKRLNTRLVILALLSVCLASSPWRAEAAEAVSSGSLSAVQPFLEKSCLACHSSSQKVADVDLEALSAGTVADDVDSWEKVALKIRTGEMPPKGFPRPEEPRRKPPPTGSRPSSSGSNGPLRPTPAGSPRGGLIAPNTTTRFATC